MDDGRIVVRPKSTLDALRKFSNVLGFTYGDWNTQSFGRKLIDFINEGGNGSAKSEKIKSKDDAEVDMYYKFRRWCEAGVPVRIGESLHEYEDADINKASQEELNLVAKEEGFNSIQEVLDKYSLSSVKEALSVSDKGWDWWVNLNDSMKFALLFDIYDENKRYNIEQSFEMPYLLDEQLYKDADGEEPCDFVEDRSFMGAELAGLILSGDITTLDITRTEESEFCDSSFQYDFEDLDVVSSLTGLNFYYNENLCYFPESVTNIKNLTYLNMARTNLGEDDIDQDLESLLAFAKAHPKMEELDLTGTPLAYELEDNDDVYNELKELMSNCKIVL